MNLTYSHTEYDITEHAIYTSVVFVNEQGDEFRVRGSAFRWQLEKTLTRDYPHQSNK